MTVGSLQHGGVCPAGVGDDLLLIHLGELAALHDHGAVYNSQIHILAHGVVHQPLYRHIPKGGQMGLFHIYCDDVRLLSHF